MHFDRRFCALVKGAVDNVGPVDQFVQIRSLEAKRCFGDMCAMNLVHDVKARVEQFTAARVVPEVLGVLGAQESALVMIEPPCQIRMGRILEIDDNIDVAVEKSVFEELVGAMRQPRIHEFCVRIELAL